MHATLILLSLLACGSDDTDTGDTGEAQVQCEWQIVDLGWPGETIRTVVGAADVVYIAGDRGLLAKKDGKKVSMIDAGISKDLVDLWTGESQGVWAVGSSLVLHYAGTSWSAETMPQQKDWNGVWGAEGEVWVGGEVLDTYHYDGSTWTSQTQTGFRYDFWGTGAADVYSSGSQGTYHYDGSTWTSSDADTSGTGEGVSGSSTSDVHVVGWRFDGANNVVGMARHFDGNVWRSVIEDGDLKPLHAVWASGPGEAWAVGDDGTLAHWDGSSWTKVDSGVDVDLYDIWGSGPHDVWAVGASGTVLHYTPVE